MIRLTAARNADFTVKEKQDMMGLIWANEQLEKTVDMLKKYTKTAKQKKLAKIAFEDSDNWHYWCNFVSDKYIAMVRYALRRVDDKAKYMALYVNIDSKHPMLKTPFLRYLEYLAARYQHKEWVADYIRQKSYLMPKEEAAKRAERYYALLLEEFE